MKIQDTYPFQPPLLFPSADCCSRRYGVSGKSEQQLDEGRVGSVSMWLSASRHVSAVLFVGEENSADWVWLWVCPKGMRSYNQALRPTSPGPEPIS